MSDDEQCDRENRARKGDREDLNRGFSILQRVVWEGHEHIVTFKQRSEGIKR